MPFGNLGSFPVRFDLMANVSTPLPSVSSTSKEYIASANLFDIPYVYKTSLTQNSYFSSTSRSRQAFPKAKRHVEFFYPSDVTAVPST